MGTREAESRHTGPIWLANLLALLCVSLSPVSSAADNIQEPRELAQRLVNAILSKRPEQRLELLHPLSRACINAQTRPYFDWIFTKQARTVVGNNFEFSSQTIANSTHPVETDGKSAYPIRPTHQFHLEFGAGTRMNTSIILFAIFDGSSWREVQPCPLDDARAQGKVKAREQQDRDQLAKALTGQMTSTLRSDLQGLIAQGRKVDAILRFSQATGTDIGTSKDVVELLMDSRR